MLMLQMRGLKQLAMGLSMHLVQGGMMEEWHQKLHNNTSPDDVIICQALIAYIESGLDIAAYWDTLQVRLPRQPAACVWVPTHSFSCSSRFQATLAMAAGVGAVFTCRLRTSPERDWPHLTGPSKASHTSSQSSARACSRT